MTGQLKLGVPNLPIGIRKSAHRGVLCLHLKTYAAPGRQVI